MGQGTIPLAAARETVTAFLSQYPSIYFYLHIHSLDTIQYN